nr:MAG TPA: hypothetical protein [Caudoviricetes sp.]
MDIVYKNKKKVAYKMVPIGEAFSCRGTLYMSTQELLSASTGELYNAINMSIGGGAYFDDNEEVTPVRAQLVIS